MSLNNFKKVLIKIITSINQIKIMFRMKFNKKFRMDNYRNRIYLKL